MKDENKEEKVCPIKGYELKEVRKWSTASFFAIGLASFMLMMFLLTMIGHLTIQTLSEGNMGLNEMPNTKPLMLTYGGISAIIAVIAGVIAGMSLGNKGYEFIKTTDKKEVLQLTPDKTTSSGYLLTKVRK